MDFLKKILMKERKIEERVVELDDPCRSTWMNEEPWGFWSNFGHLKKTAKCLIKFHNSHWNPVPS